MKTKIIYSFLMILSMFFSLKEELGLRNFNLNVNSDQAKALNKESDLLDDLSLEQGSLFQTFSFNNEQDDFEDEGDEKEDDEPGGEYRAKAVIEGARK